MANMKNCNTCRHLEWVPGEDEGTSGFDCIKRHTCPMDQKKEAALLAQLDDDTYRVRYKRCFEPEAEIAA